MHVNFQENYITVDPKFNVEEVIDKINKHISRQNCEHMYVDISSLNMIDAAKVGALCSSAHFTKYPSGNLQWIVKNVQTCNMMKTLTLKTSKISIKRPIIENYCDCETSKVVAIR